MSALPSRLNNFPKSPPPNNIILGIRFQRMNLGGGSPNVQSVIMVMIISSYSMPRSFSSLRFHLFRENFLTTVHNYSLPLTRGWLHGHVARLHIQKGPVLGSQCSALAILKSLVILFVILYFLSEIQWDNGAYNQAWNFGFHIVLPHSNAPGWVLGHLLPSLCFLGPPSLLLSSTHDCFHLHPVRDIGKDTVYCPITSWVRKWQ